MTRGISEESLNTILDIHGEDMSIQLFQILVNKCEELNPWLPIDKKTPRNKDLQLYIPGHGQIIGMYSKNAYKLQPTHWLELPEKPK